MSERIHSYPKIFALGHPQLAQLLDGPVLIEEKVDGSQFSFGVNEGIICRSSGQQIQIDAPGMFKTAVKKERLAAQQFEKEGKA